MLFFFEAEWQVGREQPTASPSSALVRRSNFHGK